jgi:hypothetical protein
MRDAFSEAFSIQRNLSLLAVWGLWDLGYLLKGARVLGPNPSHGRDPRPTDKGLACAK